jgi:hypothetical protein
MKLSITFIRGGWYRKKRFAIPICLLTILSIVAIILGSVLGTQRAINMMNAAGMVFRYSFQFKSERHFILEEPTNPLHMYSKTLN